jgi:hypothetical protein
MRPRRAKNKKTGLSPRTVRWLLAGVLLVLASGAGWVVWARQPQHQITDIVISTNEPDDQLDLVERAVRRHIEESVLFGLLSHQSTKVFSAEDLETDLLKLFPRFSKAEASVFDGQLMLEATLRRPSGLWCLLTKDSEAESCWFFDDSMTVYSRAPRFSEGVYIKYADASDTQPPTIGAPILEPALRMHIAEIVRVVERHDLEPTRVTFQSENTVQIFIQRLYSLDLLEEAHLVITQSQSPREIDERIRLLLATPEFKTEVTAAPGEFAYADLRFPSRLVYKMNDEN